MDQWEYRQRQRLKGKQSPAKKQKKRGRKSFEHQLQTSSVRALQSLGKLGKMRGRETENYIFSILQDMVRTGLALCAEHAEPYSWMECALHLDAVIRRNDGAWVPIQIKSSRNGRDTFIARWGEFSLTKFGALPVLTVCSSPALDDRERRKWALRKEINAWKGTLVYKSWMRTPIGLFNIHRHPEFHSFSERVAAFRRSHPQLFV